MKSSVQRRRTDGGRIISARDFAKLTVTHRRLRVAECSSVNNMAALHAEANRHGYREGFAQAMLELESILVAARQFRQSGTSPVDQLVFGVLRKVLGDAEPASLVPGLAEKAIAQCSEEIESLRIHVNASVADAVSRRVASMDTSQLSVQVVPDAELGATTCELHTAFGIVDASLDVQLDALEQVFEPKETAHASH